MTLLSHLDLCNCLGRNFLFEQDKGHDLIIRRIISFCIFIQKNYLEKKKCLEAVYLIRIQTGTPLVGF